MTTLYNFSRKYLFTLRNLFQIGSYVKARPCHRTNICKRIYLSFFGFVGLSLSAYAQQDLAQRANSVIGKIPSQMQGAQSTALR